MDRDLPHNSSRIRNGRWWHEGELLFLIALVVGAYFLRAGELTIRGEESRRATVAIEMMRTGDWIVPRQQGELFLSRPPMHNWLIAAGALCRGSCDVWAIRIPTLCAVLLTTLVIYVCGRGFLGRLGAFTAALAFATMGEVLQMGRIAECDLVFTYLLSTAALIWHRGYSRQWPAHWTWIAGYSLTALAALTKGPQAPVYFIGTVGTFLVLRRDWRMLFSRGHILGLLCGSVIISAWQIPYFVLAGSDASVRIWLGDSTARFSNMNLGEFTRHFLIFPLEILGCTFPWSLFLMAFLSRQFRNSLDDLRPHIQFFALFYIVGFLPCWISPGGMTRYCLPLYPALSLLVGIVADRALQPVFSRRLRWVWTAGWRFNAAIIVLAAVAVAVISLAPVPAVAKPWAQPMPVLVAFAGFCGLIAAIVVRLRATANKRQLRWGVAALGGFMAVAYAGIVVNALAARSEDTPTAMARLKNRLPAEPRLVSLNGVHHLFAYHYGEPIGIHPWPTVDDPELTWFCFSSVGEYRAPLPFAWEEIAVISVDRNRQANPVNIVVIGRRLGQSLQIRPAEEKPTSNR
jgi:4-amino-4-deoxy-L-arabinose transferase-like glycosyltransferase